MVTKIIWSGETYIIDGLWDDVYKRLGDDEESFVEMVIGQGEFNITRVNESEVDIRALISVDEFVGMVELSTCSAMMDHWDPNKEDDE